MAAVARLSFLLLLLTLASLQPLPAWAEKPPAQLTVHGSAELALPADQARLDLAVVTTAPSAAAALAANSSRLSAVEKALAQAGLETGEYRTGHFEIRPEWTPRPRDAAPDWQPSIAGYTVSNSLHLTTGKLNLVGALIEAGIKAGANSVNGLSYGLADMGPGRAKAIAQAIANARSEADAAARAASVKLGGILSMQLEPPVAVAPVRMVRMAAESAAPPLTPGEVTVPASVTMVFTLVGQ
jgi:uncharacterized protein